jgi:hypothetical protein
MKNAPPSLVLGGEDTAKEVSDDGAFSLPC